MGLGGSRRLDDRLVWLAGPVVVVCVCLAGYAAWTLRPLSRAERQADVAVVLLQSRTGSELAVVDLKRFSLVRRVKLKSLCLSIDGDAPSRTVVTAQCGGPGNEAGWEAGLLALGKDRSPRYVRLPVPNPSDVAVSGGLAHIVHGFEQAGGTCVSTVRLPKGRVVAHRHVSKSSQRPEASSGVVLLPVAGETLAEGGAPGGVVVLSASMPATLPSTIPATAVTVLAGSGKQRRVVARSVDGTWFLRSLDVRAGRTSAPVALPTVEKGIFVAAAAGNRAALADADGIDLDDPGRTVLVSDDVATGRWRRVQVAGSPSALAWYGKRLLVVDGLKDRLLEFGPGATEPSRRLELGGLSAGTADMVVFSAGERSGE